MNLNELYAKRATAWEAAKNFLDTHRMENGTLSAEDSATCDRMEAEIENLTKEIERLTKLNEMENTLRQPTSNPLTNRPGEVNPANEGKGRASKQYIADMLKGMRTEFKQVTDVLEEGTDANGGYLVPAEWDSRLIDKLNEENVMRKLATKITTSGEHKINMAATKPAASWIAEGGALSFGNATFDQRVMDAHKLHVAIKVTEELLYDNAFNLERYILDQFGMALANAEEDAFLNGNGVGKPIGIFNTGTYTNGSSKGGTFLTPLSAALKADNIIDLIFALKRPYRRKAAFITADSTLAAVRKFKDGNGMYLWQPSYQAGEPDRLCGYEVHTSQYVPAMEAGNAFMAFGDFSYYNIGDRGTRSIQILRELFAGNGMIGYVMKERVDGLLVLPEAVQVLSMAQ